jgi:hypothetical protein
MGNNPRGMASNAPEMMPVVAEIIISNAGFHYSILARLFEQRDL